MAAGREAIPPVLTGVCPVLATPFDDDEIVDLDAFARQVRHAAAAGASGVMFPGYASEFYKLSESERQDLTAVAVDSAVETSITVVVAVQDGSTRQAVSWAIAAVERGAGAINLLPPTTVPIASGALIAHVRAVARAIAPSPLIVQYAPALTGHVLDPERLAALAEEEPNLRQVKVESVPAGRFVTGLSSQRPALTALVGYGGVQLIDALRRGAVGVQPGASFPELYVAIWRAWSTGKIEQAARLHRRLVPYLSYWMQSTELILAAEKLVAARRGMFRTAVCRAPGYVMDDEERAMVGRFLQEFTAELPTVSA